MAAASLNASDYVVLGMVGLGARSGYEIKRTVERSIRFFWTISPAQVYPSLTKLEAAGLLTGREEPQGNRPRRVYTRTRAGARAIRDWLTEPEPMPFELRDIGMVKLFFADALDPADAHHLVAEVRSRSETRIAELHGIRLDAETSLRAGNIHPLLTLEMGIAYHEAIVDVCRRFELAGGARRGSDGSAGERRPRD
jgi:PadR family transcriptional regulator, regulatory protein AphA